MKFQLIRSIFILSLAILIWSSCKISERGSQEPAKGLEVTVDVERQPFVSQARRVLAALKNMGNPLAPADVEELDEAMRLGEDAPSVIRIQEILNRYCVAEVRIDARGRMKLQAGPARAEVTSGAWRPYLLRVENEPGVTGPINLVVEPRSEDSPIRMKTHDQYPMSASLSGLRVEYRILMIQGRQVGHQEAYLALYTGLGDRAIGIPIDLVVNQSIASEPRKAPKNLSTATAPKALTTIMEGLGDVIAGIEGPEAIGEQDDHEQIYLYDDAGELLVELVYFQKDVPTSDEGSGSSGEPTGTDKEGNFVARFPVDLDEFQELVSPQADTSFGGQFGISVAGVPDLNQDDHGDYIIGAWREDVGGITDAGRAYLYASNLFGPVGSPLELDSPGAETTFRGIAVSSIAGNFGFSVGGIDDLNSDLRGDAVVGAPGEDITGPDANNGQAHVFSGVDGSLVGTLFSPELVLGSETSFMGQFGWSVAGVPDINFDGWGEVAVGAPGEDPSASNTDAGRAYVFPGGPTSLFPGGLNGLPITFVSTHLETSFRRGVVQVETSMAGAFGFAVAGLKDTDMDGSGEVIIGAPKEDINLSNDDNGRVYQFNGWGGLIRELISPNADGSFVNGQFGHAVDSVPDLDNDGKDDIVVGANTEPVFPLGVRGRGLSQRSLGRAYVFSGATGAHLLTLESPFGTETDFQNLANFGFAVTGLEDIDGDDLGDIGVGAPGEHVPDSSGVFAAGRAFVFSGATGDLIRTFESPNIEFIGQYGTDVAGVKNVIPGGRRVVLPNNKIDVLVGAPFESPGGFTNAGRAYIHSFVELTEVWVDFNYSEASPELGTFDEPYNTLFEAISVVRDNGTVRIKSSSTDETIRIINKLRLETFGGASRIGNAAPARTNTKKRYEIWMLHQ